jgi:hypothetical protein
MRHLVCFIHDRQPDTTVSTFGNNPSPATPPAALDLRGRGTHEAPQQQSIP